MHMYVRMHMHIHMHMCMHIHNVQNISIILHAQGVDTQLPPSTLRLPFVQRPRTRLRLNLRHT